MFSYTTFQFDPNQNTANQTLFQLKLSPERFSPSSKKNNGEVLGSARVQACWFSTDWPVLKLSQESERVSVS
jgi:hypothetical protein